ncbi:DUF2264 domain-containing protein [Maribellus sp. CM-23]|uniref:DUF2264 domain-containing protein n=1 Tax=Maribellus sp. CM-23 TaxID=2781026 RepID=UPI001F1D963C|nr:DUF2264 domain-containing protein [Maribellus sp. CM-23]MCE4564749.1 DUF2264 domain-containing protein [Maribellus sp. CM-23]
MINRRNFIKTVPVVGAGVVLSNQVMGQTDSEKNKLPENHREYWVQLLDKISAPVLEAGSQNKLKATMPVETPTGAKEKPSTYLEAVGRLLAGIAPWLESDSGDTAEAGLRKKYREMALKTIHNITDEASPDYLFNHKEPQILVDAAFLAHAFSRAPQQLWQALSDDSKKNVVKCFVATRDIKPFYSNWLLFSGMIEAFFLKNDLPFDIMRLDFSVKKHQEWYLGDGMYGDGPDFHWDYYNSYVIQPMLMDIVTVMHEKKKFDDRSTEEIAKRFTRYAAIQERLISPEGTFPAIGRSLVYRMGAFQHLAQASLQKRLPEIVKPAQVRCALTAVIQRLMSAPGTFDENGWLQIGLCGHQNSMGEYYISTGSLYLCSTAFLPLGLSTDEEFWKEDDAPWTNVQVWSGENLKNDHALY